MILDHIALIVSREENLAFYENLGFREKTRFERAYDTVVFMECDGIILEVESIFKSNFWFLRILFVMYMLYALFQWVTKKILLHDEVKNPNILEIEKFQHHCPIGILDDIEVIFLHYKSEDEAYQKWNRRKERIVWDNIF